MGPTVDAMSKLKEWGLKAAAKTGRTLLSVADRADERGGELRDQLQEKLKSSERLAQLRDGIKEWTTPAEKQSATLESTELRQAKAEKIVFSYGDDRAAAQVFGGRGCPWTGRAIALLESQGIETKHVDLDHAASGPMREELSVETGQMTVPYVYLRGEFIGGYNALDEIYRLGKLEYLTLSVSERSAHPDHGRFEIPERPTSMTP